MPVFMRILFHVSKPEAQTEHDMRDTTKNKSSNTHNNAMTEESTTTTPTTTPSSPPLVQEFGPSIWIVEGPTVSFFGFPYPTRMVLVKLKDGTTWVWSPVEWTDALKEELTCLGLINVKHIVSPNKIHHIYLKQWQEAFPQATFYAPPALSSRDVVSGVRFDHELDSMEEQPAYHEEIQQVVFHGSFFMEEVVFFHRQSKTALFCDLIQRFPEETMTGWKGALMKLDGLVGPEGSTPREWRMSFWWGSGRNKARAARATVLEEWQPENLVIAHGDCVKDGTATAVIEKALSWM